MRTHHKIIVAVECLIGTILSFGLLTSQGNTIALDWLFLVAFLAFTGGMVGMSLSALTGTRRY